MCWRASPSSTSTATRSRPLLLAGNASLLLLLLRPRPLPRSNPTARSTAAVVETAAGGSTARSAPRRWGRPPRCAVALSCRRSDAQGAQLPDRRHRRVAPAAAEWSCGDECSDATILRGYRKPGWPTARKEALVQGAPTACHAQQSGLAPGSVFICSNSAGWPAHADGPSKGWSASMGA